MPLRPAGLLGGQHLVRHAPHPPMPPGRRQHSCPQRGHRVADLPQGQPAGLEAGPVSGGRSLFPAQGFVQQETAPALRIAVASALHLHFAKARHQTLANQGSARRRDAAHGGVVPSPAANTALPAGPAHSPCGSKPLPTAGPCLGTLDPRGPSALRRVGGDGLACHLLMRQIPGGDALWLWPSACSLIEAGSWRTPPFCGDTRMVYGGDHDP
ncbi:MAG: hypothetical protein KatS3mg131_3507 [Candidatus Tectimicrobiota bacterium]|nr:MAG: hypothetical protein KatS3mg131_3507 [Candidatus Tectomicrobia bacterium]